VTSSPAPDVSDDQFLQAALAEDLGDRGDITSALTLGGRGPVGRGRIVAKAPGRLSGVALGARVFELVDDQISMDIRRGDGEAVEVGDDVLSVEGPAASLLEAERTALNVMSHLSGVATLTERYVRAVTGTPARILDTRKTTPGWRRLEKAAVVHGGGHNHRIGLFDEVLIKENHLAMAGCTNSGDIQTLVARVRAEAPQGTPIIVEAQTPDEAWAAANGGADVLLLDNFDLGSLSAAVGRLAGHPRRGDFDIEASGGVSLETVTAIAGTGVDRISIGALTHSAPVLDLSMLLDAGVPAGKGVA
jgi:nicotinate-nucleotide pyrophosphorylase (carboxylating)